MARIWSERQLEKIIPPQANDVRGRAFLSAINRLLGDFPETGPDVRDPDTCAPEVLPALIAEYSMEEFIAPGLPDDAIRRILKNRWALQSQEGTDAGVKLGLSLLDANCDIEQWYTQIPTGPANTHKIDVFMGDEIWPGLDKFSQRQIDAMLRMIDATKRASQHGTLRIGEKKGGTVTLRTGSLQRAEDHRHVRPALPVDTHAPQLSARTGHRGCAISREIHRFDMGDAA